MAEETQPKWEGRAIAELKALKAEQVWRCLEDFCNLQKWFPNVDACYRVEGVPGQPGLIRYCASTRTSSDGPNEKTITRWAKEKLLMMDPIQRCFSYELIDNNIGFNSYSATVKVLPINDDGENGCMIDWSFVADPIEGWRPDDLVSYIESRLQSMAKKIEHALLQIESV